MVLYGRSEEEDDKLKSGEDDKLKSAMDDDNCESKIDQHTYTSACSRTNTEDPQPLLKQTTANMFLDVKSMMLQGVLSAVRCIWDMPQEYGECVDKKETMI